MTHLSSPETETRPLTEAEVAALRNLADNRPMHCDCESSAELCHCSTIMMLCDEWRAMSRHAQSVPDGYILVPEGYGTIPNPGDVRKADHGIAKWLSAALDDPAVCDAMKSDINNWFAAHEPGPSPIQWAQAPAQSVPREPTEAMLNAARDWSRAKYGKPIGSEAATGCWQIMFDASSVTSTDSRSPDPYKLGKEWCPVCHHDDGAHDATCLYAVTSTTRPKETTHD